MSEYERHSLSLQSAILSGIMLQLSQATMTSEESRKAHQEQTLQWAEQITRLVQSVNAALDRASK